ncbi:MAG: hypothetical protein MUP81_00110 [Dehalococcoidia bacterium]|nr:hypothetical protein [Dehalococcoidia bacterium]
MNRQTVATLLEYWRSKAFGNEGLSMIAAVLAYEAIDLCRYMNKVFNQGEDTKIWRAEAEVAIQDCMAMLQEICTILDVDIWDAHFAGCQRAAERAREITERKEKSNAITQS